MAESTRLVMTDFDSILATGMSALLKEPATRDAVIEYIKALTDKQKPDNQWREIWYQQTPDTRIWPEPDPQTGVKGRKCRMVVKAYWDARAKIGLVRAFLTGEGDYSKLQYYYDRMETDMYDIVKTVSTYNDYVDVIKFAQEWYETARIAWLEKTTEDA